MVNGVIRIGSAVPAIVVEINVKQLVILTKLARPNAASRLKTYRMATVVRIIAMLPMLAAHQKMAAVMLTKIAVLG